MKKSLIIILSLCALVAIGTLFFTNEHSQKVDTIPKQTQSIVKNVRQETASSKKTLETLNSQKVSLQKQLVQITSDLHQSKFNNHVLRNEVMQLKTEVLQLPIVDTPQRISNCFELAETVDSLLYSNQIQDSLLNQQTNRYDSLVCIQQNQIEIVTKSNDNNIAKIDTLVAFNNQLQKQCKADKRKLAFTTFGNRFLASGLFITTTIATYLQLKNKI